MEATTMLNHLILSRDLTILQLICMSHFPIWALVAVSVKTNPGSVEIL